MLNLNPEKSEQSAGLIEARRASLLFIIFGEAQQMYSEWLLRGTLGEVYKPTIALAAFPNQDKTHDLKHEVLIDEPKEDIEYWGKITQLVIPERVLGIEKRNYEGLPVSGEQVMSDLSERALIPEMPSSIVVFSFSDKREQESVYLFAPTIVPPSVGFKQISQLAEQYLQIV